MAVHGPTEEATHDRSAWAHARAIHLSGGAASCRGQHNVSAGGARDDACAPEKAAGPFLHTALSVTRREQRRASGT